MHVRVGWDCAGSSRGNHAALLARSGAARPAWSRLRTRKVNTSHDQICGCGKNNNKNPEAGGQHSNQHVGANYGVQKNLLEKWIMLVAGSDHTLHRAVSV